MSDERLVNGVQMIICPHCQAELPVYGTPPDPADPELPLGDTPQQTLRRLAAFIDIASEAVEHEDFYSAAYTVVIAGGMIADLMPAVISHREPEEA